MCICASSPLSYPLNPHPYNWISAAMSGMDQIDDENRNSFGPWPLPRNGRCSSDVGHATFHKGLCATLMCLNQSRSMPP
jgi:hypothetical protein